MIPDNGVLIVREVDPEDLRWPTLEINLGTDGENFNRAYQHLRGAPWKEVNRILALEKSLLNEGSSSEVTSEDSAKEEDEDEALLYGLDLGVASAVLALSASGCVPISSCNGAPNHSEAYPLILFRCRRARLPDIVAVAETTGCGLENGSDGTVILYADTTSRLISFAEELFSERRALSPVRRHAMTKARIGITKNQQRLPFAEGS
jgi:hypothetical protein